MSIFIPICSILYTIKQIYTRTMGMIIITTIIAHIMIDIRLACDTTMKMWLSYDIFCRFVNVLFFVVLF